MFASLSRATIRSFGVRPPSAFSLASSPELLRQSSIRNYDRKLYRKQKKALRDVESQANVSLAEAFEVVRMYAMDENKTFSVHVRVPKPGEGSKPIRGDVSLSHTVPADAVTEGAEGGRNRGLTGVFQPRPFFPTFSRLQNCWVLKFPKTLHRKPTLFTRLVPSPSRGTVSDDIAGMIASIKSVSKFSADAHGIVTLEVGKSTWPDQQIQENLHALVKAVLTSKPPKMEVMCYVKVKSAATGSAQQSRVASSSSSSTNQPSGWTAANNPATTDTINTINTDWLLNPLHFEELEGFEAFPLHPTHTSNDWMAWLEGMAQEHLPPKQTKTEISSPVFAGGGDFMIMPSPTFSITATTASPEFAPLPTDIVAQTKKRVATSPAAEVAPLVKRAKNTEAARKSRARKAAKIDSLEHRVDVMEAEKEALDVKVAVLESEAASFAAREAELKRRVAMLESQLAESHRALVSSL
ncbi:hypothetical protein BC830DRAFT_1079565 [Chytriomyces sp. MP71]|nr:hypothetical protein BC830DRAFT_1079565 [Chytriomyces sp. MP71]